MHKTARLLTILATALVFVLHPAPALTLNAKSYVSNAGSNANPCDTVANACATFAHALTQTASGGEITVVDTGDYGPVAIFQSVNITNDGAGEASILVVNTGSTGITIEAGAGDVISLRGLLLDGLGVGGTGLFISEASAIHIQNCVIRNFESFDSFGIVLLAARMFMSDTIVFNNGSNVASGGVLIQPTHTDSATVVLDRVHLENNVIGLFVDGSQGTGNGAHVVIRDSVVSGNASDGIRAFSMPGRAPAFLVVDHTSSIDNNGTGILANGPRATILLRTNFVTRNGVGISAVNTGQLISYGDNGVNNNLGVDGVPTGSYSPI